MNLLHTHKITQNHFGRAFLWEGGGRKWPSGSTSGWQGMLVELTDGGPVPAWCHTPAGQGSWGVYTYWGRYQKSQLVTDEAAVPKTDLATWLDEHLIVCASLCIFDDTNQDSLLASVFQTDSKQQRYSNKLCFSSLWDHREKNKEKEEQPEKRKVYEIFYST